MLARMRLLALPLFLAACATTATTGTPAESRALINELLDDWHFAASKADAEAYFGAIAEKGVFLGTDPNERWTKAAFRAYADPYFAQGTGWKYRPHDRHVMVSRDGTFAWFDEKLDNKSYGEVRGTGVLTRTPDGWKIVHYNLSFAIPNDKARDVVEIIRAD